MRKNLRGKLNWNVIVSVSLTGIFPLQNTPAGQCCNYYNDKYKMVQEQFP